MRRGRIFFLTSGNHSSGKSEHLEGDRAPEGVGPARMTDEKLLQKAGRGDEAAFMLLYERHRACVYRFAYRMLNSEALAEEVTHDCFLGLLKTPARFDPARGAALRTYLYAAVRNLSAKHFRRHGGDVSVEELEGELSSVECEGPLRRLLDGEFARVPPEVLGREVPHGRVEVSAQGGARRVEAQGLADQAEEAVVGDLLGQRGRAEHPVGEAEDRLPVALVKHEEGRLVAAARSVQEFFVGHFGRVLRGRSPSGLALLTGYYAG